MDAVGGGFTYIVILAIVVFAVIVYIKSRRQ